MTPARQSCEDDPVRPSPVAVVLGSSFSDGFPGELALVPERIPTREGPVTLYRTSRGPEAFCLFRHGLPHQLLPNQIAWRANALALREVGVGGLLVTSSVGVLDASVPLYQPLLVSDLLMLENRLPDGSQCTLFQQPSPDQAHLVLEEGIVSRALDAQVEKLAAAVGQPIVGRVVFGYAPGPRTKTRAENAAWARLGAQVNSMTLGPELVLAGELGIPCCGLVVGHKYSLPGQGAAKGEDVAGSLLRARAALGAIVRAFLAEGAAVAPGNSLFRFGPRE